jgi:tetratricopeptide (TPR) repeat protein
MLVVITALVAGVRLVNAEEELFDTKTAATYFEKGIAHLKAKNYDAAVTELEESVTINPDAEAFYYLGYAYYMKGRTGDGESRKKSLECFDKAYELNPNFTPSRYKPTDAAEATSKQKKPESQEAVSQQVPSQPGQPAIQQQQTSEPDIPSQPASPIKATDRVQNIGNIPAVGN